MCEIDKELSVFGIEMVIERLRGDEITKGCSIHVEQNWSESVSFVVSTRETM